MPQTWSFGRKIAVSIVLFALISAAISGAGIFALRTVSEGGEQVISVYTARMLDLAAMRVARERRAKHVRSYLIARNDGYLTDMRVARDELTSRMTAMKARALMPEERALLESIETANNELQRAWDEAIERRKSGAAMDQLLPHFESSAALVRTLDERMNAMYDHEARLLASKHAESAATSQRATELLAGAGLISLFAAVLLAALLLRSLRRSVGPAIDGLHRSSGELEAAARQQAASAKELASTTVEIATTMRELSAMSRQISTSAKRAADVAEEAGASARAGDETVKRAGGAISGIKHQVEVIVGHMLDLGRQAQQIGFILELINELAEQTNILAINATIEAAGAGEAGKRFGVVAVEIRRLADRVRDASREIAGLVDAINEAANTTVIATEGGAKAADSGAARFAEVLAMFDHIAERVAVATSVAQEIEHSIEQQTTAVEQVSGAIGEVAMAAKESEEIAGSALETSSRLAGVSSQLATLITSGAHPPAS
jgi:methyl-accepting chemotaxis protein